LAILFARNAATTAEEMTKAQAEGLLYKVLTKM
jgi:hypothetical protein